MRPKLLLTAFITLGLAACKKQPIEVEAPIEERILGSWENYQVSRSYYNQDKTRICENTFALKDTWVITKDSVKFFFEGGGKYSLPYVIKQTQGKTYIQLIYPGPSPEDDELILVSSTAMEWAREGRGSDNFYCGPANVYPNKNVITWRLTKK